jgi:hypothetical protein
MVKDSNKEDALELARKTIAALREDNKLYEDFVIQCTELIPPSYDGDEAAEAIIIRFLTDMQSLAQVIAKLTSDYR